MLVDIVNVGIWLLREVIKQKKDYAEAHGGSIVLILRADRTLAWGAVKDVMLASAHEKVADIRLAAPMGARGVREMERH